MRNHRDMKSGSDIDFSTLLASAAHDMKNSLAMIITTIDHISDVVKQDAPPPLGKPLNQLRYEARRVNNDLMSLLTLYKFEGGNVTLYKELNSVYDFLEEQLLYHRASLEYANVEGIIECDEMLEWIFDANLLSGVINNVVNNALRYTDHTIKISAKVSNQQLVIMIEDDGPGYPPSILEAQPDKSGVVDFKTGSSSLGLYFSQAIAQAHQNGSKKGYITLGNESALGGSLFTICIPKI